MLSCAKCGSQISIETRFCPSCGIPVGLNQEQATTQPIQSVQPVQQQPNEIPQQIIQPVQQQPIQHTPQAEPQTESEAVPTNCSQCSNSNLNMQVSEEKRPVWFWKIVFWGGLLFLGYLFVQLFSSGVPATMIIEHIINELLFQFGICIIAVIVAYFSSNKNVMVTYAVCQSCGERHEVKVEDKI